MQVGLTDIIGGPFFVYVPNFKVLDGSVGLSGFLPAGQECGQLVSAFPKRCTAGVGDPYFELAWSRSFGQLRPPSVAGAFPIRQGLSVALGIGALLPVGAYNQKLQKLNGITLGNNTLDIAPSIAVTYTTPPLFADGAEFSAKLYWDRYGTNPETQYHARGDLFAPASPLVLRFTHIAA